ncbi:MAG: PQQ-like beta-propeller repeat protein [Nitrospira sp.]|nr:PQQ-like beta-propeller repeat protein [Nitrospira sp.]
MMMIQWMGLVLHKLQAWMNPVTYELVPVYRTRRALRRWSVYGVLALAGVLGHGVSLMAWAGDMSSLVPVKPRKVVSAGVGYESVETSTITVKTYDAETGATLSNETYELDVREDVASGSSQPRERIFAGGVSPGEEGLSAFTLRVYDATTGAFLWEGLLNLSGGGQESDVTHRVVARLEPKKAAVRMVHSLSAVEGQPQFSLRALDQATGKLVWADQFSTSAGRLAQAERISRAVVSQPEGVAPSEQQIEFRIRMVNDRDQQLLWEDTISPAMDESVARNDAAQNLPVWHDAGDDEIKKGAI